MCLETGRAGGAVMANTVEPQVKRELYEQLAQIGKAFGSARRLQIIELLAQSEYTVEQLAAESGMSIANTSQHLKVLRSIRLVDVRRQGVEAFYRLADDSVFTMWEQMRELAEQQVADIERLAHRLHGEDPDGFIPFSVLVPLLHTGKVIIIDVRPAGEYQSGHIPGALCIPLDDLPHHLADFTGEQDIIVYCRGPYSTLSGRAVKQLRAEGYTASRLDRGFPQWRDAALPVAVGQPEPDSVTS